MLVFAALVGAAFAESAPQRTSFVLGQSKFLAGDRIVIDEVWSTSPKFSVGDKVLVRGHYTLSSRDDATLSLFVTTFEQVSVAVGKDQTLSVHSGSGSFEVSCEIRNEGTLHVSFYSADSGRPFGGIYFGTKEQMKRIAGISLSNYEN